MSPALPARALYARHELAFRTQYAELAERSRNEGRLLPGTPGTLSLRTGTGHGYWYRRYYAVAGRQSEDLVCKDGDAAALEAMRARIEFAAWAERQVRALRQLGFQVADKDVARVLVELSNRALFDGGLVLVGTLAYMAWLNELGLRAVASRTQDVDLARRQALKLAAPLSFLQTMQGTQLEFVPVPGLAPGAPSTSVKRRGQDGLRVDVLTPGTQLGRLVALPELQWHAQAVPHSTICCASRDVPASWRAATAFRSLSRRPSDWSGTSCTRARTAGTTSPRPTRTCCRRPRCWRHWSRTTT
jgi:hypothetical protein